MIQSDGEERIVELEERVRELGRALERVRELTRALKRALDMAEAGEEQLMAGRDR